MMPFGSPYHWLAVVAVLSLLLDNVGGRLEALGQCRVNIHDQVVDLSSLAQENGSPRFSTSYEGWSYAFNPCQPVNIPYNPVEGFGDLCHYVTMCRWRLDGPDSGFYTLGIEQKQRYIYQSLPIEVYDLLVLQNLRHLSEQNAFHEDEDDSDEDDSDEDFDNVEGGLDIGEIERERNAEFGGELEEGVEEEEEEDEDDEEDSSLEDDMLTGNSTDSDSWSSSEYEDDDMSTGNSTDSDSWSSSDYEDEDEEDEEEEMRNNETAEGGELHEEEQHGGEQDEEEQDGDEQDGGNAAEVVDEDQEDSVLDRDKRSLFNRTDNPLSDNLSDAENNTHGHFTTTRQTVEQTMNPAADDMIQTTTLSVPSSSNATKNTSSEFGNETINRHSHINDTQREFRVNRRKSRTKILLLQMRGTKSAKYLKTNIILVCDIQRTAPEQALLQPLVTIQDTLYFTLRYKCCCPDGCRSSIEDKHLYQVINNHTSSNTSYISQEAVETESNKSGARHLWLVLLCNALVLAIAICIGTVCCGKGRAAGPYNALPVHLQSSRVTMASVDSRMDNFKDPSLPDRLEYSTVVSRSAQLPKLRNCLIPAIKLELGQRLGGGLYGDTYLGTWRDHRIAAKRITAGTHTKLDEQSKHWFKQVVSHLINQRHKNIATILGICIEFRQPYVINEFVNAESLKDKIAKEEDLDLSTKAKICAQAADGVAFLHSARPPILHRDIRACNILVDSSLRVKVVDFGLITMVQHLREQCIGEKGCFCDKERSAFPASIRWTAPEILRHPSSNEDTGVFGTMCDVFSFGMLMWEVLIQDDPYDDIEDEAQVIEIVCSGGRPAVEQLQLDWSFAAIVNYCNLMKACWLDDVGERPPFKQIGVHLKSIQTMSTKKRRVRTDSSTTNYLRSALSIT